MLNPEKQARFAGISTFMREPYLQSLDHPGINPDAVFIGVPFDGGTTYRPGARFGPQAIRQASKLLSPYNQFQDVNLNEIDLLDFGDTQTVPGYIEDTFEAVKNKISEALSHDSIPVIAGGDHSITLPCLRAIAEVHGPVSVIQLDAHTDLWPEYAGRPFNHGTTFHHALNEGLIDPTTSIRIGDRNGVGGSEDIEMIKETGIEYYTMEELTAHSTDEIIHRIQNRTQGPTYVSVDIDVVDPAYAPGTGTPIPGGLTSREILQIVRSLNDQHIVGIDLVELSPLYDTEAMSTAILASQILYEGLCAIIR